jgi:hypothetical protein
LYDLFRKNVYGVSGLTMQKPTKQDKTFETKTPLDVLLYSFLGFFVKWFSAWIFLLKLLMAFLNAP